MQIVPTRDMGSRGKQEQKAEEGKGYADILGYGVILAALYGIDYLSTSSSSHLKYTETPTRIFRLPTRCPVLHQKKDTVSMSSTGSKAEYSDSLRDLTTMIVVLSTVTLLARICARNLAQKVEFGMDDLMAYIAWVRGIAFARKAIITNSRLGDRLDWQAIVLRII